MTQPQDDPKAVFPSKEIVLGSFSLVKDHVLIFLKAAWMPVLAFILATAWAASRYPIPDHLPDTTDPELAADFVFGPGGLFEAVIAQLLTALLIVPAATVWVRLTVLGPPEDGRFPLMTVSLREFSYLMTYVALLVVFLTISAFTAALIGVVAGVLSPMIGLIIGAGAGILVVSRLIPALGAAAFGERSGFGAAWRMTKQDTLPLFGATVSFGLPLITVQLLFAVLFGEALYGLGPFFHGGVMAAVQALAILFASVFVGRVYAYYNDLL